MNGRKSSFTRAPNKAGMRDVKRDAVSKNGQIGLFFKDNIYIYILQKMKGRERKRKREGRIKNEYIR